MITKNLVMEIQNLVVNYESWPVKSNPAFLKQALVFPYLSFVFLYHSSPVQITF